MEEKYKRHIKGYYDEYKKEKCRTCFNAMKVGSGTKLINEKRIHFNIYGCDFKECKHGDEI